MIMQITMKDDALNIWRKVLSVCRASNYARIVVTFDGCGDSGQIEDMDDASSKAALMNPGYHPVDVPKFTVNVGGEFFHTDDIAKARQFASEAGGEIVTPFELKKQEWEEKPVLGSLASAGLGFLSGTTFGGSDLAARALGVEDDVRAITEASPVSNVVGQIGSVLTPFGAEALAAKAVGSALKGAAAGAKVGETGVKIAEAVGRGATAGIRQGITETALQDTPLTVADIGTNLGRGALLGAALDATFTGALAAAMSQLQQARTLSSDFYEQSLIDVRVQKIRQMMSDERSLLERFKS
jgi:hypothetical protein